MCVRILSCSPPLVNPALPLQVSIDSTCRWGQLSSKCCSRLPLSPPQAIKVFCNRLLLHRSFGRSIIILIGLTTTAPICQLRCMRSPSLSLSLDLLQGRICCRTVERQDINLTTTPTSCLFMLLLVLGSIWRGSGGQRRERVTKEVS